MNKCLERVNDRHFWNPGVVSYAMIRRCRPNSRVLFLIVTSIVYGARGDLFIPFITAVSLLKRERLFRIDTPRADS